MKANATSIAPNQKFPTRNTEINQEFNLMGSLQESV